MENTFRYILVNTSRRTWRRRSFWVINFILAGLPLLMAVLMFLSDRGAALPFDRFAPRGLTTLALYYLVLPMLVTPILVEDFGRVGEILFSGPLDNLAHFAGLFAGLWIALLTGSLIQLGGWFLADLLWFNPLGEWAWLFILAVYLLANTLALALIFLLAMLLRRTLPLLLIWSVGWVVLYLSNVFIESFEESFYPLSESAFRNIYFHNLVLSPSLGLGLSQDQVVGMFAWFLGLSLAAFSLALLLSSRVDARRSTRWTRFGPSLLGLALVAATGGFFLNGRAIAVHDVHPSPMEPQIDWWEVLSQRTEVEVDGSGGDISGRSTLNLALAPNKELERPEIVIRLNPGLSLRAVRDESSRDLSYRRIGDSVVIDLPNLPQASFTLHLAWEGRLQISRLAYEQDWKFYQAPYPWNFTYMPQALQAYLQPQGGFLLRDGDWKPWPWTTWPHQAGENILIIRTTGGTAAASVPLEDGAAVWIGSLPKALLSFLPPDQTVEGYQTVAYPRLAGQQQRLQTDEFAAASRLVAAIFKLPNPSYVVLSPYLNEVVWSDDLLLVPDGSGYYLSRSLHWLYQQDLQGPVQMYADRTALYTLIRAHLLEQLPPPKLDIMPLAVNEGWTRSESVFVNTISEAEWTARRGRWMQSPEYFDIITYWKPRREVKLSSQGEWSAVAFWLAMENSSETIRQVDLDQLAEIEGKRAVGTSLTREQYNKFSALAWPWILEVHRTREIVQDLHSWSETLGQQEAVHLASVVVQESNPETVQEFMQELASRSGLPVGKEQP
jgi:hypothetical protein